MVNGVEKTARFPHFSLLICMYDKYECVDKRGCVYATFYLCVDVTYV